MTDKLCFQCKAQNAAENLFCGSCGSVLDLKDYISEQVSKELTTAVRDRDILETESAIRVFERAWGWARLSGGVFALAAGAVFAVTITLAGWVGWKELDLAKTADKAKQSIEGTSERSLNQIQVASKTAIDASGKSISSSVELSKEMNTSASKTKAEFKAEAIQVKKEVANSQAELSEVYKLRPEFGSMRSELTKATSELADQQKVLSSSEDFVKKVFSTHSTSIFNFQNFITSQSIVVPNPQNARGATVYMLIPDTPINGTLQLQYKIYVQPVTSYLSVHNLIIFSWGDPAENLKTDLMYVSCFPDKSDPEKIKSISFRDGRVYADDQPLPKFGQADPDWKGNKWMAAPGQPKP